MASTRIAIGIDIGGTGTKGGLVADDGEVVVRAERPTDEGAGTKSILNVVEDLLQKATAEGIEPVATGVGAAGFIDFATGTVTFSPNLTYDDPHVAQALRSRFNMECVVDNDANAAAWGERAFGVAKGLDDVAVLTLGTGLGSGFIAGGRMVRGSTGAGAEFGHTVIDPKGPPCPCGLRGCLEQFASGHAIARMATEALADDPQSSIRAIAGSRSQITGEDVARAARELDETARAVLRRAGEALGIGLSNVANVFDPEAIVLCGSVVAAGEAYLGPARDTLARMTAAQRRRPMRLDVTALGHDAGIIGGAALAFDVVDGVEL
jgi:glucokinase